MLRKLVNRARSRLAAGRRYSTTVFELSRLSDRELSDIGINRGDIPFVAKKNSKGR